MLVVSSSDFLKEFTIYAEKTHEQGETLFIHRSNDHNLVAMSMEQYNDIQKKLYEAAQQNK